MINVEMNERNYEWTYEPKIICQQIFPSKKASLKNELKKKQQRQNGWLGSLTVLQMDKHTRGCDVWISENDEWKNEGIHAYDISPYGIL